MLIVAALVMGGMFAATPATAATSSDRGGYLALGDSISFGFEPSEVTPVEKYFNADNFKGYPEYFAGITGLRLTNASCPGETTGSFIDVKNLSFACSTPEGYRTNFPLHVDYKNPEQSQLDYAVKYLHDNSDTRLVTITIGANDVFLCQAGGGCTTPEELGPTIFKASKNLATILSRLRTEGGYSGPVLLVTYYALDYNDPVQAGGIKALNEALTATAQQFDATIADGFTAFKLASYRYNGEPCAARLLIALPKGGCDVHPTVRGDVVLTATLAYAAYRARAVQDSSVLQDSAVLQGSTG